MLNYLQCSTTADGTMLKRINYRDFCGEVSLQFTSYGHDAEGIEATEEDITRYAGQSALGTADRILLALLKRIPQ
jgi:hypothetical protein